MKKEFIVSKMNTFLHISTSALVEWLGKILPRTSEDWWEECVLDRLSHNQRELALERGKVPRTVKKSCRCYVEK